MGVNSFLMGYLCRFEVCGLTLAVYNERIRSAAAARALMKNPGAVHAPGSVKASQYEHGPACCAMFALVIVSLVRIVIFSGFLPSKYSLARWRGELALLDRQHQQASPPACRPRCS